MLRAAVLPAAVLPAAVLLAAAALLCLGAVAGAGALGPVPLSGDSLLDRLTEGDGSVDGPGGPGEEVGAVADDEDDLGLERDGGMPPEVVLSLLVATVAAALLVRSVLRARPAAAEQEDEDEDEPVLPGGEDEDLRDAVAGAARAGLDRLDRAGPGGADDAVLACWVELEDAGGRAGSARVRTDTPTDFAVRLQAAVPGLDPDVLADLRRTYSRVRFGPAGTAGPDDVRRARAALEHLLAAASDHGVPR